MPSGIRTHDIQNHKRNSFKLLFIYNQLITCFMCFFLVNY
nr:MAG TPA: hypothetical protein [Caudoviricetes sp.]